MPDKSHNGFTIIEVLITLAVAGFIFLMVLTVLPTLQRNSRNNQRKQDVSLVLSAVSQWELNNSGNLPQTNVTPPDDFLRNAKNKLSFYDLPNITVSPTPLDTTTGSTVHSETDTEKILVTNHAKCRDDGTADGQGAGYNDVVAVFAVEGSNGSVKQCQQL